MKKRTEFERLLKLGRVEEKARKNAQGVMNKIFIRKTVRGKLPGLPFARIKSAILGDLYELSLVFAGDTLTRRLNRTHRGKDKSANVLSFPLEQNSGEIFLNLQQAKKMRLALKSCIMLCGISLSTRAFI